MNNCKIITIANRKGGVGKTTTTINLGHALLLSGYKVLLVDFDSQANLSKGLGCSPDETEFSICELLLPIVRGGEEPYIYKYIVVHETGLHYISAKKTLSALELELVGAMHREYILKTILDTVRSEYDFILIDSGAGLGLLTVNALMASDSVLIASTAESDSKDGVVQLAEFIHNLQKRAHKGLTIDGILLCMIDERLKLNKKIIAELSAFFDSVIPVYDTKVVRRVELATAKDAQKTIFEYLPHSQSALAYINIAHEFLTKGGYTYDKNRTA